MFEAELDFPDQLIPQESQPSGQSYFKYCATACKLMKSRKRSHHFLHTPLFFNGLITINGY
ncbi:hypothetical protein, partial [Staphylococcus pseudintermedius]|uniref:hypothetical protein n=1 Tax=Staphylococcus pseudintermedius TaxID=283734 RepID=UPI0036F2DE9D